MSYYHPNFLLENQHLYGASRKPIGNTFVILILVQNSMIFDVFLFFIESFFWVRGGGGGG